MSVVLSIAVFLEITAPRWEPVAKRPARLVAAVALAWLPLGNFALSSLVSFSQWYLLFWAFLVLHRPEPGSTVAMLGRCVLVVLLGWSHPLALALVPVAAWRMMREPRRSRIVGAAFIVAVAAYLGWGHQGGTTWDLGAAARGSVPTFLDRVVFESWLGAAPRQRLHASGLGWLVVVIGGFLLITMVYVVRRAWSLWSVPAHRLVVGAAVSAVAIVAAAMVVRGELARGGDWGQRYVIVARWLTVLVTLLGVATAYGCRPAGLLLAATFLITFPGNRWYYRVNRQNPEFIEFIDTLERQEAQSGHRLAIDADLTRDEWPIRVRPR